jgi:hypothetical protein
MASEAGEEPATGPPPVVVLDANLLYPFHLRNLFVQFGVDGVLAPRWTARIHEEWIAALVARTEGRVTRERLLRTRALMERVLPDADAPDWEARLPGVPELPDPGDRHVVAAALAAGASTVLTMSLRDFPAAALAPLGVAAAHPDVLLCALFDADSEAVRASAKAAHVNLARSTPSFVDFAAALGRQGLPRFARLLVGAP